MRSTFFAIAALAIASMFVVPAAHAQIHGAIFTTTATGNEVNFNIYASKDLVYLDGGPGPGAPQSAASLPDGDYVFMVTDPAGKKLLSTDNAECRIIKIINGIIDPTLGVADSTASCVHHTDLDNDHGALTVQLLPYDDTPNNGGVYKAWVTPVGKYLCPLNVPECTLGKHGFVNRYSKTDNFKVKITRPI